MCMNIYSKIFTGMVAKYMKENADRNDIFSQVSAGDVLRSAAMLQCLML